MRGLYWVRNDLRIADNLSLRRFCEECSEGTIIWTPSRSFSRGGVHRQAFVRDCLFHLSESLKAHGQQLVISLEGIIPHLDGSIEKVYYTSEYSFDEKLDEKELHRHCEDKKIKWEAFDQGTLVAEKDLPFKLVQMPFIFTEFRKLIEADLKVQVPLPVPERWPKSIGGKDQVELEKFPGLFDGGEAAALDRLKDYLWGTDAIQTYKQTRNGLLNWNDSSKLSPWLGQGLLSARQVYSAISQYEDEVCKNESTYWLIFELLWRDYFKFFSKKYKQRIFLLSGVTGKNKNRFTPDKEVFLSWCSGKTADPFINANMTELNSSGWMSNRGRQNVASYLIHQLNLPWTWGAEYFEEMLIDYDCDSNWGNWLYLSGNGSDPRARIFNPRKQAMDYDPDSTYTNKWFTRD